MSFSDTEKEKHGVSHGSSVGARLRAIRQKRGLTLQQVVEQTGFALSFLSLLERDKVTVTIDNLARMAKFYGIRMVSLFDKEEGEPVLVFSRQVLESRRQDVGPTGASFTLLADKHSRRLEPLYVVIGPGGGDPEFRTHDGESLVYVIEGALKIDDEAGLVTTVSKGDAAWYLGSQPRRIQNASATEQAVVIIATAPPTDYRDRMVDPDSRMIMQREDT